MNKQIVIDLITVIGKSSDRTVIYKALVKLRTDLIKDRAGINLFYECDGIPPLVRLIGKPYEKILDVALSILGNCCTTKECCKQAISHGVVSPLLTILKSIPSISVQCRACRLIGNLARESNEKICNLAKGIGIAIAGILDDNKDINTLNMAIRASRLLWNEMPFYDEFVRHDGVKKIISILVRHSKVEQKPAATSKPVVVPDDRRRVVFMEEHISFMESVNSKAFDREIMMVERPADDSFQLHLDNKDVQDLFSEILRSLQNITNGLSMRVIFDFHLNELGCNCIVFFAKQDSPFRSQALKILSNLSKSDNSTKFLSRANATCVACNLITQRNLDPPLSEAEEKHCISIICFLAGDAWNRAKIRMSGAFTRIMEIAKNTKCNMVLSMILIGLQSFKYDNISIDLMIKIGLVSVLVERLDLSTRDLSETHAKRVAKRSNLDVDAIAVGTTGDDAEEDPSAEDLPTSSKRMKVDFYRSRSSPSTTQFNYAYPNSPCSSASMSPRCTPPRNNESYDDMDSEYSPVCSDIEEDTKADDDGASTATEKTADLEQHSMSVMKLLEECSRVENELDDPEQSDEDEELETVIKDDSVSPTTDSMEQKTVELIIGILCSVSYRMKHASDLCTADILNTLLRTCRVAFRRKSSEARWDEHGAPLVLAHIVQETNNFVPIIKQNIIFKIYEMTKIVADHEDCTQCIELRLVGQGLLKLLKDMGETGYGRGEMAHLLLKGDRKIHKQIAVVTTYIISDPKILHTLLVECGGLYTTMEIILTKDDDLCNEACNGLTALSKELKITVPDFDADRINLTVRFNEHRQHVTAEDVANQKVVTFIAGKTDENAVSESVLFNEDVLTGFSDVFSSMLRSDFRESKNKEIHLQRQTVSGIRYFLDAIQQRTAGEPLHIADNKYMGAVLETYDMCQVYMLAELERDIYNLVLRMLTDETVLRVFEFAMANHKQELSELAINYYLSADVAGPLKVAMYRAADNSDYFKEWNQMMLDSVVYTCQNLIIHGGSVGVTDQNHGHVTGAFVADQSNQGQHSHRFERT